MDGDRFRYGSVCGKHYAHTLTCYKAVGFDFRRLAGFEPSVTTLKPDSMASELAFLVFLADSALEAEDRDPEVAQRSRELLVTFARDHACRWFDDAAECLERFDDDFYAGRLRAGCGGCRRLGGVAPFRASLARPCRIFGGGGFCFTGGWAQGWFLPLAIRPSLPDSARPSGLMRGSARPRFSPPGSARSSGLMRGSVRLLDWLDAPFGLAPSARPSGLPRPSARSSVQSLWIRLVPRSGPFGSVQPWT